MRKYNVASTYVAPQAPVEELDPLMQHALTQTVERDVWVPLYENVLGGCGLFVAIVCGRLWWIEYETASILVSTGYIAGVGTGVACIIRFWGDEFQRLLYHCSRGWAEGRTSQELEWLESEVERLSVENRQLSVANAQMVRHVRTTTGTDELPKAPPRIAQDEYAEPLRDALALCRFQDAHRKISRDAVIATGAMDRQRWEAAKRLLEHSGVIVANGMIGESPAMAMGKVRDFVGKQRQMPAGFVGPHVG